MESIKNKAPITDEDQNMLNQLQELIKRYHPKYSHLYFGDPELYFHKVSGYVYTIDDRPVDGTLKWYSTSGELLYTSINSMWEKATTERICNENRWLENIERVTKETKVKESKSKSYETNSIVNDEYDFC